MWICPKCGEVLEDQFDSCWKCTGPESSGQPLAVEEGSHSPRVKFETFSPGFLTSQKELFDMAAAFASELGTERVISITQEGVDSGRSVTVWYWTRSESEAESPSTEEAPPKQQNEPE